MGIARTKAYSIPMVDAKDLYIANNCGNPSGYSLKMKTGETNLRRFRASLDPSLDRQHLERIYFDAYGTEDFTFKDKHRTYCRSAVVVTFKYTVREWNKSGQGVWVKLGENPYTASVQDCFQLKDGALVAIVLDEPTEERLTREQLAPYFEYRDGAYRMKKTPKKVVTPPKLRELLYSDGFYCEGKKYCRWKRSAGSARVGKCLFIDEKLYSDIRKWDLCGLSVTEGQEVDLAALESYIALTSSSIVDTLDLDPQNILVIEDYESVFEDDVVSVEEHDGKLTAERKRCKITNSIWDGQGLIDRSAMGAYQDKGMVLLRNQFFKCCCFNTNLQAWFADNGVTSVEQLNGQTNAKSLEDIKLVTTPSAIKYLKFGTLQQWRDNIEPHFGVVKYEKQTHFFDGRLTQTHYQLLNTLQMTKEEVAEFVKPTLDYLTLIRNDPAVLRYHIKYPIEDVDLDDITPAKTKNDVIYKLLGVNNRFAETKLYIDFVRDIIRSQIKSLRLGHVLVNGNYSTLFGNPMEMLEATIGRFDGEIRLGVGHVHTTRFPYGATLCGSRSPHITMSNVWLPVNVESDAIDRYFNLTTEIVCINSIGENVLQMLSGCDFDSDTVLLTDDERIINAAKKNENVFPVAVTNVSSVKKKRHYCMEQLADLDTKTASNMIGDIVNLSQELNTMIWDKLNTGGTVDDVESIYLDVCKLNTMSGLEIDSAKKEFLVKNSVELKKLRSKYVHRDDKQRQIKPSFFAAKDKSKGYYDKDKRDYARHHTTMDYLQAVVAKWVYASRGKKSVLPPLPFHSMFNGNKRDVSKASERKIGKAIKTISDEIEAEEMLLSTEYEGLDKVKELQYMRIDCIEAVGNMNFGESTMYALLERLELPEYVRIKRRAINILFGHPNTSFYNVIKKSSEVIPTLVEKDGGEIVIYGFPFTKEHHPRRKDGQRTIRKLERVSIGQQK